MKEKIRQVHARVREEDKRLIRLEAESRGCTENDIINTALAEHFGADMTGAKFLQSLADGTNQRLRDLDTRFHALANMFLNFIPLFLLTEPKVKDGYNKTKEFREAANMTNSWFSHMVKDIHDWNPDFFAQLEDVMLVRGGEG